jgi:hypothetical protein
MDGTEVLATAKLEVEDIALGSDSSSVGPWEGAKYCAQYPLQYPGVDPFFFL